MDNEPGEMIVGNKNYKVKYKKHFLAYKEMLSTDKLECFDFAYGMSYGKMGEHRDFRSGGVMHRTKGQIFINTFQGKMAEFALYRYLMNHNIEVEKPDTKKYKLGKWDSFDLECQGKYFSVKSTKSYGNLLLLETKDWNENGEYIPNISNGKNRYDYIVLVRFNPDGEAIMKNKRILYQKDHEIPDNIGDVLKEEICGQKWEYDFPGFIYHSELLKMIREKHIIPQNAILNGTTKMDAQNYYFQAGNMHPMSELYTRDVNLKDDDRASFRLKRKCPKCGRNLVLRHGYNWFWGCEGYFAENKCRYHENL